MPNPVAVPIRAGSVLRQPMMLLNLVKILQLLGVVVKISQRLGVAIKYGYSWHIINDILE